jgi:hypothetical protein
MAKQPARPAQKGTTKWDVEYLRALNQGQVRLMATKNASYALCIAATGVPIWTMQGIVHQVAGKTTQIEANIPLSIVISVSIVVNVAQLIRSFIRKRSLEELRQGKDVLEAQLGLGSQLMLGQQSPAQGAQSTTTPPQHSPSTHPAPGKRELGTETT